ncbi:sigma 54-interacting transcriptional regulator [Tepidimicrobium xylanilyticum]|uniref:PAS domain S-box-containing protein n=1 Tax=Tepidimicrobium xylanilyticum TaxID=1123352 RepID=A0A1H2R199_9FIRM|nr:sigma 54-interacting transcriptional regulator [Tepidimicrobium xylanilyticum]GMG95538.1 sigma-54-dependent Fis family transcriptional regulator [Tepidimicrobium xylanilyticum]SDW13141.1 PAS domain S-box-containing protein [Tepidimicrobium xylanilyticum]
MNFPIPNREFTTFLLDSLQDGILIVGEDGKLSYGNRAILRMLDLDEKDLIITHFPDFIKDEKLKAFFVLDGEEKEEEYTSNGLHLLLKYIPYINKGAKVNHIFIVRDITEIKDSQSQLLEEKMSLDMIEDLLEHVYEGFALVDNEGKIVKWNYEDLLGIKEEDAIGKHVTEVIENTRLHIVVKTGEKEIRDIQRIQGYDMVANRVPIIRGGKIIGAVGAVLFKDASDIRQMAKELIELENKINEYKGEIERLQDSRYTFNSIITRNPKMEYLKKLGRTAAQSNSTVLILGESGTGKELFAQAIHKASYRKFGPFIPINCAAIPRELLESELFGYEAGAFTGARREGKPGKFELANGGTIFLDEIGDMPLDMQVKLLRVLEEKEYERVGGNKKITLDARIIAATNEKIEEAVEKGKFREDLYYRLNVINIDIPPLRDRKEDIPLLCEHLIEYLSKELNMGKKVIEKETMDILMEYHWPGNVRELRNVLERAITISTQEIILPHHLPDRLLKNKIEVVGKDRMYPLKDVVAKAEKDAIICAIRKAKGNKTLAAEILGIHRTALYRKMEKYDLGL